MEPREPPARPRRGGLAAFRARLSGTPSRPFDASARPRRGARRRRRRDRPRVERARRSSPGSARAPPRRPLHPPLPRHPPPRRERSRTRSARFDLDGYDGVLAFGEALARSTAAGAGAAASSSGTRPRTRGCSTRPRRSRSGEGLVWIGNWGDDERSAELESSCSRPAATLGLPPRRLRRALSRAALAAWRARRALPRLAPQRRGARVFARHLATVHVPRRFYVEPLPGIPTIRVFEALACGIPLVSRALARREGLFRPGAGLPRRRATSAEMERHLARAPRRPGPARERLPRAASRPSGPATPAPTASTSSSRILDRARGASAPMEAARMRDRLLRLQPSVRPTGTAPPPTTAACSAPWPSGATRSPSTSPTPSTARSTATSTRPTGREVEVYPATERRMRARGRRGGRRRRRRQGLAASASSTTCCSRASSPPRGPRRSASSGTWTRPRRSPSCAQNAGPPASPRACPRSTSSSPTAAGRRWSRPTAASARGAACRSTTRSIPTTHHPVPAEARFARRPRPSSATACPTARRGSSEFFLEPAARLPGRTLPARRQRLGDKAMPRERPPHRPCRHARSQRLQRAPARRPQHRPRQHGPIGFSPATRVFEAAGAGACLITDAWVGHRALPRAPGEEVLVARDGQDVAELVAALTPERARAIGEAARRARPRRAHLRPSAARRSTRSCARRGPQAREERRVSGRRLDARRPRASASPRPGATATRPRTARC